MSFTAFAIGIIIGAVVVLIIEHGWGWLLAQYHQRTGR